MKKFVPALFLLILVTVVLQGRSVSFGLLLDDFNHRAQLRDGDWSLNSLIEAAHLGGPRRRVTMWWQDQADLYFFRPLAFAVMRAEYLIGDWRPAVMHGFSLAWAVLCAFLVIILARRITGHLIWSVLAGVLFLLHPANALTVRWIACQNAQMAAAFILLGLLAYGRYAQWWHPDQRTTSDAISGKSSAGYLVATLVCFAAALGCRESAIMFAPLLVWGDLLLSPRRIRHNWLAYLAVAFLVATFLVLRYHYLGGVSIPQRPYGYPMNEPGFFAFITNKLVYYLLGLFAFFPIVGFAGLDVLTSNPGFFYGTLAVLVLVWVGLLFLIDYYRRRRALFFIGLAVLSFLPVLPVFASAHHLYAASAFGMTALVVLFQGLAHRFQTGRNRSAHFLRGAVFGVIGLVLTIFVGYNFIYSTGVSGMHAASQLPVKEAVQYGRPFKSGDRLFFINLTPLGFNCIPGIEETSGVSPLKGYVLTFSPEFPAMTTTGHVQREGEKQLRVWLDDQSYFTGLMGRSMLEAVDRKQPFPVGETFVTEDFEARVVRANQHGVQELLFTFRRPLDFSGYHFFFGSRWFTAYPLRFD